MSRQVGREKVEQEQEMERPSQRMNRHEVDA